MLEIVKSPNLLDVWQTLAETIIFNYSVLAACNLVMLREKGDFVMLGVTCLWSPVGEIPQKTTFGITAEGLYKLYACLLLNQ